MLILFVVFGAFRLDGYYCEAHLSLDAGLCFCGGFWEPTKCVGQAAAGPDTNTVVLFSVHSDLTAVIATRIIPAKLSCVFKRFWEPTNCLGQTDAGPRC